MTRATDTRRINSLIPKDKQRCSLYQGGKDKLNKKKKISMGHWNIPMLGLHSSSQTCQLAQETRSYAAFCTEPWAEPQPESDRHCWDENWCGTSIKLLLYLRLRELVHFSDLGYLPQQKVNHVTRDDHSSCYNKQTRLHLLHLPTQVKSAIPVSATCLACCCIINVT